MARRMTDAELTDLYARLIAVPLVVVLVAGLALTALHVMALHGRRILRERTARIAGWLVFGLGIGLTTQFMAGVPFIWIVAVAFTGWVLYWAWREGRLGEAGVALIGAGLPWLLAVGLFMVLLRADPLLRVVDIRFLYVVLALLVVGIGIILIVSAPRPAPRPDRELPPLKRAMLLRKAIDREQAMGPMPAPIVLALLVGITGSTSALLLGSAVDPLVRDAVSGAAFIGLSLGVLWVATPRRVVDAHGVIRWVVDAERRMWGERFGRPMPRLILNLKQLLDWLPDGVHARPLRIEVLATMGRIDEAREELAGLPLGTAEERATEAELAAYVAWCDAKTDEAAIDRWAEELPGVEDPAARLRLRVSYAVALARRASISGDRAAVDHLLAVRPLIGSVGSRLRDPGVIGSVIVIVVMGIFLAFSRWIAELGIGAG
jgi:hypothetical protein